VTAKPVRPGYKAPLTDDSEQSTGMSVMLKCVQMCRIWKNIKRVYTTK